MDKKLNDIVAVRKSPADLDFVSTEAYNVLRTNLAFSFPGQSSARVIGLTSSNPSEGKSYNSVNMAFFIAKGGKKTLLVSADLRRPSIEKSFDLKSGTGLSDLLAGNTSNVSEAIIPEFLTENLSLMPYGVIPPNPSELLASERMQQLMEMLREMYDYIIVDLPPINSVIDAVAVSPCLDGIVMIVRHGYTRKKNLYAAVSQLRYSGVRVLGFVYNDYRVHSSGYGYKKYQYKYYHSSHSGKSHDSKEKK